MLIYDIESDPDARDDFLHGFLSLRRQADGRWPEADGGPAGGAPCRQAGSPTGSRDSAGTQARELAASTGGAAGQPPGEQNGWRFHPLLALHEHGEARLWQRLRTLLARQPDWPVLHYGETESINLLRLAERQGAGAAERLALKGRLIDVHQRLRQHWLLPVNSYGLKAVAGWRGLMCGLFWQTILMIGFRLSIGKFDKYQNPDNDSGGNQGQGREVASIAPGIAG